MSASFPVADTLRQLGRSSLLLARMTLVRFGVSPERPLSRIAAIGLLTLVTGLSAKGLAATSSEFKPTPTVEISKTLPPPDVSSEVERIARLGTYTPKHYAVRADDSFLSILETLGISDEAVLPFVTATPKLHPLLQPQPGQRLTAGVSPEGRLEYLRLYIDSPRPENARTVEVSRIGSELIADVLPFSFATMEAVISGPATSNLTQTTQALGIPEDIAEQLHEVWDGAEDPLQKLSSDTTLRIIYEQKFAEGRFVRNGRLLAAQVINSEGVHEAFWFSDNHRPGAYYTLDGRSSSQTFLRIPLDIKDVSSEFAPLRRHPITGVLRPHNGTDLRAPMGSRILAAADGRVTRVAYQARGYGHYVEIDHGLGRKTLYAHMQRVQKGIRPGVRVEKGQLIGFVGRTGLATGPHLHYELIINGVQNNPATANLPDTENLSAYQLARLRAQAHTFVELFEERAKIEGKPSPRAILARMAEQNAAAKEAATPPDEAFTAHVRTVGNGEDSASKASTTRTARPRNIP